MSIHNNNIVHIIPELQVRFSRPNPILSNPIHNVSVIKSTR